MVVGGGFSQFICVFFFFFPLGGSCGSCFLWLSLVAISVVFLKWVLVVGMVVAIVVVVVVAGQWFGECAR